MTVLELFQKGGVVMYPLLACSILAVAIVSEKLFRLRRSPVLQENLKETATRLIEAGAVPQALESCERHPGPFARVLAAGLEMLSWGADEVKESLQNAGRVEGTILARYLGALGTIASVAPLLGLLGTVLGMIKVFQVISEEGLGQITALSNGIAEALITTVAGLIVAIPTLIMHNYFQNKVDILMIDVERGALEIMGKLLRNARSGAAASAAAEAE